MAADLDRQRARAKARADIKARATARDSNRTPRKNMMRKKKPTGLRAPPTKVKTPTAPKAPPSSIGGTMDAIRKHNKRLRDT